MRTGALIAATLLIATPLAAATVKQGVDAWQRGDYATAVNDWRPLADKGDPDAAFDLAQAYKLGRGVPADLASAKRYYGLAAKAGHVQGAANYGLLLFQDGDRRTALPWIEKASDAGDPRAQYVYGTALFNGDLVARDWPRAYALMTRAAAAGLPQATTSLAEMNRYMAPHDKQKGLKLASDLASRPMPPISRQMLTAPPAEAALERPTAQPDRMAAPPPASDRGVQPVAVRAAAQPEHAVRSATAGSPAGGAWMIQLGAFGSRAAAETAWRTISGKAHGLGALHPVYEKSGAMIRLRAGGLTNREAADRVCATAKAAGGACFPVAP